MANDHGADQPIEQSTFEGLEDELSPYEQVDELDVETLEGVVSFTLDWSVQSLLERVGTTFDVTPAFQRRDAWTIPQKSRYIESLILGLPVPAVVLAEDAATKGKFIVLDGKQRLITIKQFAAPDDTFASFKLRGMEFLPDLEGFDYAGLVADAQHSPRADALLAQPVRTVVVRNWRNPAVLYQMFVRLNQSSVPLAPQELRQALAPGPFTSWINQRSIDSQQIRMARRLKQQDFRMRDAEMLLRFVALHDRFAQYHGNLRLFLDEACFDGNDDWRARAAYYEDVAELLEQSIEVTMSVFDGDAFMRYDATGYVGRFNIAVFDAMTLVFASLDLKAAELNSGQRLELRRGFEGLCIDNEMFSDALTSTTKTPRNTFGRVYLWAERVQEILKRPVPIAAVAEQLLNDL